jgi:hypothetical protein
LVSEWRLRLLWCSGARRAGAAPSGDIGLVDDGSGCCSTVVRVALVTEPIRR